MKKLLFIAMACFAMMACSTGATQSNTTSTDTDTVTDTIAPVDSADSACVD